MNAATGHQAGITPAYLHRDASGRSNRLTIDHFDQWSDSALAQRFSSAGGVRPRLCGGFCQIDQFDALEAVA